jgi:hypothetical protein
MVLSTGGASRAHPPLPERPFAEPKGGVFVGGRARTQATRELPGVRRRRGGVRLGAPGVDRRSGCLGGAHRHTEAGPLLRTTGTADRRASGWGDVTVVHGEVQLSLSSSTSRPHSEHRGDQEPAMRSGAAPSTSRHRTAAVLGRA